jgi:hypothetical protein
MGMENNTEITFMHSELYSDDRLSFLRLRRIGNLSLKKDAGQAGMTKYKLKILNDF